jgi:hypothetical protein
MISEILYRIKVGGQAAVKGMIAAVARLVNCKW